MGTVMDSIELPESPVLEQFFKIAWDQPDSVTSAWDSCEVGCAIPVLESTMCGGKGLKQFDYKKEYCDQGSITGSTCCPKSAASCAATRECKSTWDVGCLIPRKGDGMECAADEDCSTGVCRGGRCCNEYGRSEGCAAC